MLTKLACPNCHGRLGRRVSGFGCASCQTVFEAKNGCVDFTGTDKKKSRENDYYNESYAAHSVHLFPDRNIWHECKAEWFDRSFPSGKDILSKLGDLQNKTILCLGNGLSFKELYFAKRGASLWVSDLSINAMLRMKASTSSYLNGRGVEFHAIDAFHLPFEDFSFDVIYGFAFVHHLANKISFLTEVFRVLNQKGVCVFFDDAFSPVWHLSKTTFLMPFMKYIHKRRGISPEDLRATFEGGLTEEQVRQLGVAVGFSDNYFFVRSELLLYLWLRGMKKVFGMEERRRAVEFAGSLFAKLDDVLGALFKVYRSNMIRVVWGFIKDEKQLG